MKRIKAMLTEERQHDEVNQAAVKRNLDFLGARAVELEDWEREFLFDMASLLSQGEPVSRNQAMKVKNLRLKYSQ